MSMLGIPEIMITLLLVVTRLLPLAAGVWALVTLYRIRMNQDAILLRLEAIEQALSEKS